MTKREVDSRIDAIARRQHGVFTHRQAAAAGATSPMRRRRLANGTWVRLDRRVYGLPSHPGTWHRQCMAAVLAIVGAAASHGAAAALHGLAGSRQGRIHVVVPRGTNHRTGLAVVHESPWPRATVVDGIRTVTLADTFFHLAGVLPEPRLRRALDEAIAQDGALLAGLLDRFVELSARRLPGIGTLRRLLAERDDGRVPPESELEQLLGELLAEVDGLPPWQRQMPLPGSEGAGVTARVDVLVPDWRLVVEADGRRWHTRIDDFERDRWRDNLATASGYDVLRFSHHQLTAGRAESLALLGRYAARLRAA